ncbi:MAG: hypothetical protein M1449_12155 [Candidatus Thermoplasmatota archaeon]|nr:hypothetical protein [Candidatus Thermoplasmatota archaeon]
MHRDQEQLFAPSGIVRVAPAFAQEMRILQRQRGEVAGAHADDGLKRRCRLHGRELQGARRVPLHAPQRFLRRKCPRLDRLRPVGPGEIAVTGIPRQPDASRRLLGLQAARHSIGRIELAHHDGAVFHGGAQTSVAQPHEPGHQRMQSIERQESGRVWLREHGLECVVSYSVGTKTDREQAFAFFVSVGFTAMKKTRLRRSL